MTSLLVKRVQTFLALMDTIHDYGDVSRAMKVFQAKGDLDEEDSDEKDDEGGKSNPMGSSIQHFSSIF